MKPALSLLVVAVGALVLANGCSSKKSCATNADCDSSEMCEFAIGSCAAQGECQPPPPSGTGCFSLTTFCGCNGVMVTSGCTYQDGYASGPSEGAPAGLTCGDGGAARDGGVGGAAADGG